MELSRFAMKLFKYIENEGENRLEYYTLVSLLFEAIIPNLQDVTTIIQYVLFLMKKHDSLHILNQHYLM